MPARPIVLYPDRRLRRPCDPVGAIDEIVLAEARDLAESLLAHSALGLAGPHIGLLRRIVAARGAEGEPPRLYVDPVVVWSSGDAAGHEEGSVSMPGVRDFVSRPSSVRVSYRTLAGDAAEELASGFPAAILQHEIDQLDGVFWIDRLSRLRRDRLLKRWHRLGRPEGG